MNIADVVDKLQTDFLLEPDVTLEPDTELLMSGLLDSLAVVNVVAWIEGELGISIDPGLIVIENFESAAAMQGLANQLATQTT